MPGIGNNINRSKTKRGGGSRRTEIKQLMNSYFADKKPTNKLLMGTSALLLGNNVSGMLDMDEINSRQRKSTMSKSSINRF
jgi:hypothetical protein